MGDRREENRGKQKEEGERGEGREWSHTSAT